MLKNKQNILAVKIDVDTLQGYLEGVSAMRNVLNACGVKASFYFSMGPDNSGKAIFRIFRKGFITKMLRTKATSTYGLKTMMYGTLLPAPDIVKGNENILRDTFEQGFECGLHAWDHVKWQDKLPVLSQEEIRSDLQKACALFEQICGRRPQAFAAPGWQLTQNALSVLDEFNFNYCSNVRGKSPHYPALGAREFKTLEIPSTLPTMDEVFGANGINDDNVAAYYLEQLKEGLNVITVHAEMEGRGKLKQFEAIIKGALEKGYKIAPMQEVRALISEAPVCEIYGGYLEGRAGKVAVQR